MKSVLLEAIAERRFHYALRTVELCGTSRLAISLELSYDVDGHLANLQWTADMKAESNPLHLDGS